MACASQAMISANSYTFTSSKSFLIFTKYQNRRACTKFTVRASSDDSDCNDEECAPDKEVGRVSVEWLSGEKTKVVATFPTGYVEKDTAVQTNIYSVEVHPKLNLSFFGEEVVAEVEKYKKRAARSLTVPSTGSQNIELLDVSSQDKTAKLVEPLSTISNDATTIEPAPQGQDTE